jgi:ligand-binding sensor domain-containing protein
MTDVLSLKCDSGYKSVLVCIILLITCNLSLQSQTPAFINFNESNGLPSNESYYVLQDHKGFIWITTDNGVVKFDGMDFTLFNKQNGLADNVNFSIHEDKHSRLWFRSYG